MSQIPLHIALDDDAQFSTYYAPRNALAVAALQGLASPGAWICGPAGVGKSHLLQAFCADNAATYYSLDQVASIQALEGISPAEAWVLDDIDSVLGDPDWERFLFALYNDVIAASGILLISALQPPGQTQIGLPDLQSRFGALPVFRLQSLNDDECSEALFLRARSRGLTVTKRTLRYLVERTPRDMKSLYGLLDRLDRYSWETRRPLNVRLIRDYFSETEAGLPE